MVSTNVPSVSTGGVYVGDTLFVYFEFRCFTGCDLISKEFCNRMLINEPRVLELNSLFCLKPSI